MTIRIRKSKNDRQHNGRKKKNKQPSTIRSTVNKRLRNMNPTKYWGELPCSGRVSSSHSTSDTRRVTLVTNSGDNSLMRKGPGQMEQHNRDHL